MAIASKPFINIFFIIFIFILAELILHLFHFLSRFLIEIIQLIFIFRYYSIGGLIDYLTIIIFFCFFCLCLFWIIFLLSLTIFHFCLRCYIAEFLLFISKRNYFSELFLFFYCILITISWSMEIIWNSELIIFIFIVIIFYFFLFFLIFLSYLNIGLFNIIIYIAHISILNFLWLNFFNIIFVQRINFEKAFLILHITWLRLTINFIYSMRRTKYDILVFVFWYMRFLIWWLL